MKKKIRNDWDECIDCGTIMNLKFSLPEAYYQTEQDMVYQCPKCKRIDLKFILRHRWEKEKQGVKTELL